MLVDWVLEQWKNETLIGTVDTRLEGNYNVNEAYLALKLGLICSHPFPNARPTMRHVMQYLDGVFPLPEISPADLSFHMMAIMQNEGFDNYVTGSTTRTTTHSAISGG
ncbi:hypothetical protein PR202_ga30542 [Eleusine coracana subsp. coracana]|uniref:Uncharacterized protein n=1 Tax=Eleusine coracana subsp. coracana TaxID=191504 RepID=A0AAV5DPK1_ELECO|nr:hypothetical protein PR202_ga30508 [Eleusine coracana subsp. coracana]GJN12277.1 hypothetical protein PR202_ga30542 [Eleusine coracana subsp. coracana]